MDSAHTKTTLRSAVEQARAAWHDGFAIIAATVNQVLAEMKIELQIVASAPPEHATLLKCRLRIRDALLSVENDLSREDVRRIEDPEWRPWYVGDINADDTGVAGLVGCAYIPTMGDELVQKITLLRSRHQWTEDTWRERIIEPITISKNQVDRWFDHLSDTPGTPDGPHPPNLFYWQGKVIPLGPKAWRIVNQLWTAKDHKSTDADVEDSVWGMEKPVTERALVGAIFRLNKTFLENQIPIDVNKKNGWLTLTVQSDP